MALAILGWPVEKIPAKYAQLVLEGARAVCKEAGIVLAGGHSIDISEPVFGLAVSGIAQKHCVKKNNSIKEGDSIYLTKPLGSGVLASALKRGVLKEEHKATLLNQLCTLNKAGEIFGGAGFVNAMTDITGFGLLGHLLEMAEGSACSIEIQKSSLPKLDGFNEYAGQFIYPENTTRNFSAFAAKCDGMMDLDFLLMCDPQTNGGLMLSVSDEKAFLTLCAENGIEPFKCGTVTIKKDKPVIFS